MVNELTLKHILLHLSPSIIFPSTSLIACRIRMISLKCIFHSSSFVYLMFSLCYFIVLQPKITNNSSVNNYYCSIGIAGTIRGPHSEKTNWALSFFFRKKKTPCRQPTLSRSSEMAPMDIGRKPKLDRVGRVKSKCYTAMMRDLFFNR